MFEMKPVGFVKCAHVLVQDDVWGGVVSHITLTNEVEPDALDGLEQFSHAEIIFLFHNLAPEKVVRGSRHPRDNPAWPRLGIFAQRGRSRPNRIGSTIVRVVKREGIILTVSELDAVDGTPVLDIKPVMTEFLPREPVIQPAWSHDVMKTYWNHQL